MSTILEEREEATRALNRDLRSERFTLPRRRWPGVLALCILAAGATALAVSSFYDPRSTGEKLDATVQATVQGLRDGAQSAARDSAQVGDRAATALGDASITAAVKTSLAADPKLSAVKIEVTTTDGVVTLEGPAPDELSRGRAAILAAAPSGVNHVENRLVVAPPGAEATR